MQRKGGGGNKTTGKRSVPSFNIFSHTTIQKAAPEEKAVAKKLFETAVPVSQQELEKNL